MIRAVLDANIFVSATLIEHSIPARILRAWHSERFILLASQPILEELKRVLRYPKIATRLNWSAAQLDTFLDDLAHLAILTPGRLNLQLIEEDPADDRYLECCVEGAADYLVSGDKNLLRLRHYEGTTICTARAFLSRLSELGSLEP